MEITRQFHIQALNHKTLEKFLCRFMHRRDTKIIKIDLEETDTKIWISERDVRELCRQIAEEGGCSEAYHAICMKGYYKSNPFMLRLDLDKYKGSITIDESVKAKEIGVWLGSRQKGVSKNADKG